MKVCSISHSTFMITLDSGMVIMTDPWFGEPLMGKRIVPPGKSPGDITKCDLMIVSHNHIDHLDNEALAIAKRLGSIVAGPESVVKRARRNGVGIDKVMLLKRGDRITVGDATIHPVSARHMLARDALGYVVKAEGRTIYFSGDTVYHDELVRDLAAYNIDAAFVQIACWVFLGKEDGMTARTAARLVKKIHPKIVIPMHYHTTGKVSDRKKKGKGKVPDPSDFVNELSGSSVQVRVLGVGVEEALF